MKYKDYLERTSKVFEYLTDEIITEFNFDLGNEYEIVICKALRQLLPEKYGICRGFITTEESVTAGDDIIIFDRNRFNSLRPTSTEDYIRKEYIPIEAVYAYIEAKYTLNIEGEGGNTLSKACSQVSNAKALPREDTPLNFLDPYLTNNQMSVTRTNWPNKLNTLFGVVFAHRVRQKVGEAIMTDSEEIKKALLNHTLNSEHKPDLIVAGNSCIIMPFRKLENGDKLFHSPFYIPNENQLNVFKVDKIAFGIGIANILYALDTIRLGKVSWPNIIGEGLGIEFE
jgi:hypothetical protein